MAKIFAFFSNDVTFPNESGDGMIVEQVGILYDPETKLLKTSNKMISDTLGKNKLPEEAHQYIMSSLSKNKTPQLLG